MKYEGDQPRNLKIYALNVFVGIFRSKAVALWCFVKKILKNFAKFIGKQLS